MTSRNATDDIDFVLLGLIDADEYNSDTVFRKWQRPRGKFASHVKDVYTFDGQLWWFVYARVDE